jgi:hypothetical protein
MAVLSRNVDAAERLHGSPIQGHYAAILWNKRCSFNDALSHYGLIGNRVVPHGNLFPGAKKSRFPSEQPCSSSTRGAFPHTPFTVAPDLVMKFTICDWGIVFDLAHPAC